MLSRPVVPFRGWGGWRCSDFLAGNLELRHVTTRGLVRKGRCGRHLRRRSLAKRCSAWTVRPGYDTERLTW